MLVSEGAVPWYLPIIVAAVLGAIIGSVLHSKSSATSAKVSDASEAGAENKLPKLGGPVWAGIGAITGAILTFLVMSNFNEPMQVKQDNRNSGNTVHYVLTEAKNTITGMVTSKIETASSMQACEAIRKSTYRGYDLR